MGKEVIHGVKFTICLYGLEDSLLMKFKASIINKKKNMINLLIKEKQQL
jgi:hypothetical protein